MKENLTAKTEFKCITEDSILNIGDIKIQREISILFFSDTNKCLPHLFVSVAKC